LSTSGTEDGWYTRASRSSASTSYDFGAQSVSKPKIEKIKIVLVTERAKRAEFTQPLPSSGDGAWMRIGIPLARLRVAPGETDYSLRKVIIFSDVGDTIYVGAIRTTEDKQALSADPGGDMSYAKGDSIVFRANASGGLSPVRVSWDFDDKDGLQEDAVGQVVKHTFKKSGDFTVTLTVSDINGAKPAFVRTLKVHVE